MATVESALRLDATWVDYLLVLIYFLFVLGIGWMAKSKVSNSIDFFLSGRGLPAWVTALAFVSANLGAVEIIGMSANGVEYGFQTMHYFWIGAVPAMIFLGLVMMPFYYGSKVRSVPEFMRRRFGNGAHLVNAISFALAQLLIAGVNLFLLATIVEALLGWPMWVALVVAGIIVLSYITLGGLSAAIYNEVLQFFVIIAALAPLTVIGVNRVGGWQGLKESVASESMLHTWPGTDISGFGNPVWSVIGIVLGLGFVLSFGYWTTNFVEVQRAMASDSISAARKTPILGAFPKMFIPFLVVLPGMVASVIVGDIVDGSAAPNEAILYLMRDLLPNGLLGVAIAGLLASFMAGMAANISAFNTVMSYDIWETYVVKDRADSYYLRFGRWMTVVATCIAVFTALLARNFGNVMDYLQTLFGFFNAPLFATFILGMFWKRMTPHAGWAGLVSGTVSAIAYWAVANFSGAEAALFNLPGQGTAFVAAGIAFAVDVIVSVAVTLFTTPKPDHELVGFVSSVTPKDHFADFTEKSLPWYQRTVPLGIIGLICVVALNVIFA